MVAFSAISCPLRSSAAFESVQDASTSASIEFELEQPPWHAVLGGGVSSHNLLRRALRKRAWSLPATSAPFASLWHSGIFGWRRKQKPQRQINGKKNEAGARGKTSVLQTLPIGSFKGSQHKQYVFDGKRIRAVDPAVLEYGETRHDRVSAIVSRLRGNLFDSFFPEPSEVTPDYWAYARWRASHRLFSSVLGIFATQSLLAAVGVGAQRSLPAAAAINWVLKDGLGRLGRLGVAARFGQSFDADLKRFRFSTSVLFTASVSLEYLTPLLPHYFLPLASVANVGKSMGLTTYIATQPVFLKSFTRSENLADINAKSQAQSMVMDTLGLALAVSLNWATRHTAASRQALPLAAFPLLAVGDLTSIYHELKAIHLRSLNRERAELIVAAWLDAGAVPTAQQVSRQERLVGPCRASGGLPLGIGPLEDAVRTPDQLHRLLARHRGDRYLLAFEEAAPLMGALPARDLGYLKLMLRDDATSRDILTGVLQAAYFRRLLRSGRVSEPGEEGGNATGGGGRGAAGGWWRRYSASTQEALEAADADALLASSHRMAQRQARRGLPEALQRQQWQMQPFMLSSSERGGYSVLQKPEQGRGLRA